MTIGQRIKQRREELGLTVSDVAKRLGKHRATVYRYESDDIEKLGIDVLEPLAVVLRTTPAALMGWADEDAAPSPGITEDVVTFEIIGDVAAGYDHIATSDWDAEKIDVPLAWLHGHPASDFFCLRVKGDSMYPQYQNGDVVLVKKQSTLNRSGEIGVVIYGDELATLKKVEYVMGEDWMLMIPINASYPPIRIEGEDLEHCRVLGLPVKLIRDIKQ